MHSVLVSVLCPRVSSVFQNFELPGENEICLKTIDTWLRRTNSQHYNTTGRHSGMANGFGGWDETGFGLIIYL